MKKLSPQGFTLLETVIYLALFSILLTAALSVTYQLLESSARTRHILARVSHGDFVVQKLTAASAGSSTISVVSSTTISILRHEEGREFMTTFKVDNGRLLLSRSGGLFQFITPATTVVSDVTTTQQGDQFTLTFYFDGMPFRFTTSPYE